MKEDSALYKMLKVVVIVFVILILIVSLSDDPFMFVSTSTLSMMGTALISLVCAHFSEKFGYKYYKVTIILSTVIIGVLSFGVQLGENIYMIIKRDIIYPELLSLPVMLAFSNIGISISIQMMNRKKKYINPETYGCEIADGVIEPSEVALKLCDIDNEIINMRHIRRVLFTSPSHYKNSDDPKESFSKVDVGTEIYKVYYKNDLAGYVMINADIITEYHIIREKYDEIYLHLLKFSFDKIIADKSIRRIEVHPSQRESMEIVINSYNKSRYTYLKENDKLYAVV